MPRRSSPWLFWSLLALYWIPITAGLSLQVFIGGRSLPADLLVRELWRIGFGAFPTVGAVILARKPRNVVGRICCLIGAAVAAAGFGQDYAIVALQLAPGSLPGGLVMGWLGSWPWHLAIGLSLSFLLLLFPDGRLPSPGWRPVAWMAAVNLALLCFWAAFQPRPLESPLSQPMPNNPVAIEGFDGAFRFVSAVSSAGLVALAILSAVSMVVRYRRSKAKQRQQLKWFTYGAMLSIGAWLLGFSAGSSNRFILVELLGLIATPTAIGIAILRYRLYDIDRLINRTLVYGVLTALLGLAYLSGVFVLGNLLNPTDGQSELAIAATTLTVAALFQPARRRVQVAVDRRFNRRRYDAAKTVEAFSTRLRDQLDPDTLTAELLTTIRATVQPTHASLWRPDP